ncbi:MAG: hypothetical protein AB1540_13855 [Bdellovibrionota bacterium]
MIKLAFQLFKILVIAIVTLLIGQIPVGQKRISDHVWDMTRSKFVQVPIHWISQRFDFSDGKTGQGKLAKKNGRTEDLNSRSRPPATADSEYGESDQGRLSGLLKQQPEPEDDDQDE